MDQLNKIQAQIAKLQKDAAEIKSKDFKKTVEEIKATMKVYQIKFSDLVSGDKSKKAKVAVKKKAVSKKPAKAKTAPQISMPDSMTPATAEGC